MKPITVKQWEAMNPEKRSWLVCHLVGDRAHVYWECIKPDGGKLGGSYDSLAYCAGLIHSAKTITKKESEKAGVPYPHPFAATRPVCSIAYPLWAAVDHIAIRLGLRILEEYQSFAIEKRADRWMACCPVGRMMGVTAGTIEEAVALLYLLLKGKIQDPEALMK